MLMKNKLSGWKDIYNFTLVQTLKSKAFIVSFIIFITFGFISMPLLNIFSKTEDFDQNQKSPIEKVYYINKSNIKDIDFSDVLKIDAFKDIQFSEAVESLEDIQQKMEEQERNSIIFVISEEEGFCHLEFYRSSKGAVNRNSIEYLGANIASTFDHLKLKATGITEEQYMVVRKTISSRIFHADVNGIEVIDEDTRISQNDYWFLYGILFVVLLVNIFSSAQVATSIVTDKSTRVVEYLLTSVRPLAVILGKILAMLTVVVGQTLALILTVFVSGKINTVFIAGGKAGNISGVDTATLLSQFVNKDVLGNLNIVNILCCIIVIALGLIFYATLAGLAGSTVSKIEEVSESLTLFSVINLVGAYMAMGAAGSLMGAGENAFLYFSMIFPISAPFILPGAVLLGKTNLVILICAVLCQIIFIILLLRFVARVYETLILHMGNRIKLKELLNIGKKSNSKAKK